MPTTFLVPAFYVHRIMLCLASVTTNVFWHSFSKNDGYCDTVAVLALPTPTVKHSFYVYYAR